MKPAIEVHISIRIIPLISYLINNLSKTMEVLTVFKIRVEFCSLPLSHELYDLSMCFDGYL